ncbi:MAG: tetratricopeptide repeat protein [Bacteroidetes bacterium]|nr:tetratricopeptide repeat protein [Bacteroidota bacterium]
MRTLLASDRTDTLKIRHLVEESGEFMNIGGYDSAILKSNLSLELSLKNNFSSGIISSYGNIGLVYYNQGDFPKALDFFYKELKKSEEWMHSREIGVAYHHLGVAYAGQSNNVKALEYYFKALQIYEQIGNESGKTRILGNIGLIYLSENKFDEALDFSNRALSSFELQKDEHGIARQLFNIGIIYKMKSDDAKAFEYYFKALALARKLDYVNVTAGIYLSISSLYRSEGKTKEAISYIDSALVIQTRLHIVTGLRDAYYARALADSTLRNFPGAFEDYKLFKQWSDSASNQESSNLIARREMNYELEKAESGRKAEETKKKLLDDEKDRKQKLIDRSIIIGLIFMLVFAAFIFRSLRVSRKQNRIIKSQKNEVEDHQKRIIDSITYAKRLQEAILPSADLFKKHFSDHFIFHRPKDIVAGDFYWLEEMDDHIFLAVADCTGHGVPGAMVSVVCNNALNRTIKEFGLKDPGKILDKVNELVVETFRKSSEEVRDGMDISLLVMNVKNKKNISWAGANNPLWIVRRKKLLSIPANKQPIGHQDNRNQFTTQTLMPEKEDCIYFFSDGFADQFGGSEKNDADKINESEFGMGKKYKYKRLSEKLCGISDLGMNEQKNKLEKELDDWQGGLEQVDDICIVGIRI